MRHKFVFMLQKVLDIRKQICHVRHLWVTHKSIRSHKAAPSSTLAQPFGHEYEQYIHTESIR